MEERKVKDIPSGKLFKCKDKYYMKVQMLEDPGINAVNLLTGEQCIFKNDDVVEYINKEVIIFMMGNQMVTSDDVKKLSKSLDGVTKSLNKFCNYMRRKGVSSFVPDKKVPEPEELFTGLGVIPSMVYTLEYVDIELITEMQSYMKEDYNKYCIVSAVDYLTKNNVSFIARYDPVECVWINDLGCKINPKSYSIIGYWRLWKLFDDYHLRPLI